MWSSSLAIDRAKELFGAEHANVQPHSGSQANMAVYFAACKPGDTILGMNLSHGGHLTHGSPVNFSGKLFNIIPYGVSPETETIDYDEVERLAVENKPKMIVVGASAYPRIIDFPAFRDHCRQGRRCCHGGHGPFCRARCRRAPSRVRCPMPILSPPPPTRPCADRAAA